MLIYVLLIFFILVLICSYFAFKRNIIHPAVVFNLMFLVSIISAIYNIKQWQIELHAKTLWIFVLMGLEYFVISFAIQKYYEKKHKVVENKEKTIEKPLEAKKWKLYMAIIFDILYIVAIIFFVLKIASQIEPCNTYSEALKVFKANTIYKANVRLPKLVTFSTKFVIAFAYIYMFIAIYNLIYSEKSTTKKIVEFIMYLTPSILYAISLILQSSRGSILRLILAGLIIFMVLYGKKKKYVFRIKIKYVIGVIASMFIVLFSFYSISGLIGRDTLGNNMMEYITMYAGGSVQLFDLYLQKPPEKSEIIGKETFWGTYRFLDDYNIINLKEKPTGSLEWRKSNGHSIGNVYTAYRRWIQDFGILGCALVLAAVCSFYNIYYNKLKYYDKNNKDVFNIALIFYAYMYYHLALISIDCRIFDEIIPASLSQFVVALVIYFVTVKNNMVTITKNKILEIKEEK